MPASSSRREKIEALLADDPRDTFLRYSLALELQKEGQQEQSLSRLNELIEDDPPYVPAFLMAGQQLVQLGQHAQAREVFARGIAEAQSQGDQHAAEEMAGFAAQIPGG